MRGRKIAEPEGGRGKWNQDELYEAKSIFTEEKK